MARNFLRCGLLVHGFTRMRCDDCAFERLVPFSCKARAVCSSCGGRRMAERAAHLVEAVLPVVPVRQWVLTVPHRLRYRLAFDHALCRAVFGVFVRAVLGEYRRRARRRGLRDGQGGCVTALQRFGSGLQLNVHAHTLALDGVFTEAADRSLRFHPAPPPARGGRRFDGERKRYQPRGFVVDTRTNALWGMQFIWPFKGDFRIVYLNGDYTQTVIGREKRDYVWIMARQPAIPESDYQRLLELLAREGYDTAKMRKVPQRWETETTLPGDDPRPTPP